MRFIILLALVVVAGCGDSAASYIEQIKRQVEMCESHKIPYEVSLSPSVASPEVIQYCQANNIPYKIEGSGQSTSHTYETRSERTARFNELGDKLHPTKAEEREYLRLYSEMHTE